MNAKVPTTIALRPDLMQRVERYRAAKGTSRSEAVGRLLERALDEAERAEPATDAS